MLTSSITFILTNPQMGENIGAAARIMANFGFNQLRLVAPRDGWPNPKAEAMASGATHILEKAESYDSLEEALSGIHHSYALTARSRGADKHYYRPEELPALLIPERQHALIFGCERSGLSNDDVSLCDHIITIPTTDSSSINLAQSVAIMAYECSKAHAFHIAETSKVEKATHDELLHLVNHLESALEEHHYFKAQEKKPGMIRNIRSLFKRQNLTSQDVRTLRGIIRVLESSQPYDKKKS